MGPFFVITSEERREASVVIRSIMRLQSESLFFFFSLHGSRNRSHGTLSCLALASFFSPLAPLE